jgi:TatD DNase family protein
VLGFSSDIEEDSLEMNTDLYATIGCHPTRSGEFEKDPSGYFQALDELIGANLSGPGRAVAVGECGLDYDRTHFASTVVQKRHFRECNHVSYCFVLMGR